MERALVRSGIAARLARFQLAARAARHRVAPPPETGPLPPRYRHPTSGDIWDGVGSQPDWLRRALLQEGYTVEELRVAELPPALNGGG